MKATYHTKKNSLILITLVGIFLFNFFVFSEDVGASTVLQTLRPSSNNLGLVGFWSFNGPDVVNGRVMDRSGNTNHGTPNSIATTTFYTTGKVGQGVQFDGVNDTVSVPDNTVFDNTSQLTISLWVKPTLLDGQPRGIVSKRAGPATSYSYSMFFFTNNNLYIDIDDSTERFSSNTAFKVGQWYHIVLVYDGTLSAGQRAKLYVNGVLDVTSTEASSSIPDEASDLVLGFLTAGSAYFQGNIDDTRIYNRAFSASEVNRLYNSGGGKLNNSQNDRFTDGLIGMWSFDGPDIVNGRVIDRSPTLAHGTPIDIATSTFYKMGKIGQGVTLDGVDDCVRMGDVSTYDFGASDSFTVSGWYRRMNNSNTGMFVTKKGQSGSTDAGFYYAILTTTGGAIEARISDGTNQVVHSPTNITGLNDGRWHHIALVVDRNAQTINSFIDGRAETASSISTVGSLSSTNHFVIGARSSTGTCSTPTPISVDDVRVYNRALSATEITGLYNLGGGKQNASQNKKYTNSLVGLWSFDGQDVVNGKIIDASGNANNGTPLSIATTTFYTFGKIGQAVNFDGVDDTISVPHSTTLTTSLHSGFTISAWVKPDSYGDTSLGRIIDKSESTVALNGFAMYLRNNVAPFGSFVMNINDSTPLDSPANTVPLGQWTHLVTTIASDGSALMYANGILVKTGALNSPSAITTTQPLYIGSYSNASSREFDGLIDDIRVYSRPLQASEVRQLYDLGR